MNMLYRILDPFFNHGAPTVEKPAVTTESIRAKLKQIREKEIKTHEQSIAKCDTIKNMLELFPIGVPATALEISACYGKWELDIHIQTTLEELVRTVDSSWGYVIVDGLRLYQKTA
jgi:hypothetical protein